MPEEEYFRLSGFEFLQKFARSGNATIAATGTDTVVADTTSGKTWYITDIIISNDAASLANVTVKDGSGGTTRIVLKCMSDDCAVYPLRSPLKFTSGVYINTDQQPITVTVIGFEK